MELTSKRTFYRPGIGSSKYADLFNSVQKQKLGRTDSRRVAGTPEAGGWTTREVKRILRGLGGLNFVGFDLVEVAPAYDSNGKHTLTCWRSVSA